MPSRKSNTNPSPEPESHAKASDPLEQRLLLQCVKHGLTKREREVITQAFAGKTDKEIAAILGTSPRTVHHQLERIYRKLGVETRTGAIRRLLAGLTEQ